MGVEPATGKETAALLPKSNENTGFLSQSIQVLSLGLVNTILAVPCLYGYAAIIYGHPAYQGLVPMLAKLVLLSSGIHQVIASFRMTLPFIIVQVQDSGLIFLSAIATSLGFLIKSNFYSGNLTPEEHEQYVTASATTAVVGLSLGTFLLGAVLFLVGRARLAKLVSYLPMPVIAGYLAFIGFFCLLAGIAISTAENVDTWWKLSVLFNWHKFLLALPALIGGYVFCYISRIKHPLALPAAMVIMPSLFYVVLFAFGVSIEDARKLQLVSPLVESVAPSDVFATLDFSLIYWSVLPRQFGEWFVMTIILAFSTCLDVAAIEIDLGRPVDINYELETIGISNLIAGCFAGLPGSFIISQSTYTARTTRHMKPHPHPLASSRVVGWVVATAELILFALPIDVMSYVPRFFFAATLIFIGYELLYEWLIQMYSERKVSLREHIVCIATFIAVTLTSVQTGLIIGIAASTVNYLHAYSTTPLLQPVSTISSAKRSQQQHVTLQQHRERIQVMKLNGFVFFGTAIQLFDAAKHHIMVRVELPDVPAPHHLISCSLKVQEMLEYRSERKLLESIQRAAIARHKRSSSSSSLSSQAVSSLLPQPQHVQHAHHIQPSRLQSQHLPQGTKTTNTTSLTTHSTNNHSSYGTCAISSSPQIASISSVSQPNVDLTSSITAYSNAATAEAAACVNEADPDHSVDIAVEIDWSATSQTQCVLLDFSSVSGVDVTAIRSCFLLLSRAAHDRGFDLIYCGLPDDTLELLINNDVIPPPPTFATPSTAYAPSLGPDIPLNRLPPPSPALRGASSALLTGPSVLRATSTPVHAPHPSDTPKVIIGHPYGASSPSFPSLCPSPHSPSRYNSTSHPLHYLPPIDAPLGCIASAPTLEQGLLWVEDRLLYHASQGLL